MPFAVWLDLEGAEPVSDESAAVQIPDLISDLIASGWEVVAPVVDCDDDIEIDEEVDGPPELLDVRVLSYPSGAFVGLAIDTHSVDVALAIGTGLARHLTNAAPALMGWTLDSIRANTVAGPNKDGEWLPLEDEPRPHFPIAEYLPNELQDLCARYLLAGAVRHLVEPTARSPRAANAADVIAGAAAEHPWGRELAGALGHLLVAAGRVEDESGSRSSVVSRGEGDPTLVQALLDVVRHEIATPSAGLDDDPMRGHVLLEQFMEQHDLAWNRVDSDLDEQASERRSRQQLRTLLWAGLRALTTLTSSLHDQAAMPWLWLSVVNGDDPVIALFAEDDQDHLDSTDIDARRQITAAARAHLWARVAILHPTLLNPTGPEFTRLSLDDDPAIGPLHHLLSELLPDFGTATTEAVLATQPTDPTATIAATLLPVLRDLDNPEGGAYDALYHVIDDLVPADADEDPEAVHQMLVFLRHAVESVGPERAREIAGHLLRSPSESACVLVTGDDRDTDTALRRHLLALACTISADLAVDIAQQLPQLSSDDPRAEPALRHETTTWWSRLLDRANGPTIQIATTTATTQSAEPTASLLSALASGKQAPLPESISTTELVTAVVRTISTLGLAIDDPILPFQIILGHDSTDYFDDEDEDSD